MVMVRAANRAKRSFDDFCRRTLSVEHVDEHLVVEDIERFRRDLGRHMSVTDMPGEIEQIERSTSARISTSFSVKARTSTSQPVSSSMASRS